MSGADRVGERRSPYTLPPARGGGDRDLLRSSYVRFEFSSLRDGRVSSCAVDDDSSCCMLIVEVHVSRTTSELRRGIVTWRYPRLRLANSWNRLILG